MIRELVREQWDQRYNNAKITDWEKIPASDLCYFIKEIQINLLNIHSVLEIGCGRGYRIFYWILNEASINRDDVKITCIDLSKNAINDAQKNLKKIHRKEMDENLSMRLEGAFTTQIPEIKCDINFECQDFLTANNSLIKYDLIIDWMCFHEVFPGSRADYICNLSQSCNGTLILKVFSVENSSRTGLSQITRNIKKYQFDQNQIASLFKDFSIIRYTDYKEDLEPTPKHEDGIIAAKRAYYLTKCGNT